MSPLSCPFKETSLPSPDTGITPTTLMYLDKYVTIKYYDISLSFFFFSCTFLTNLDLDLAEVKWNFFFLWYPDFLSLVSSLFTPSHYGTGSNSKSWETSLILTPGDLPLSKRPNVTWSRSGVFHFTSTPSLLNSGSDRYFERPPTHGDPRTCIRWPSTWHPCSSLHRVCF